MGKIVQFMRSCTSRDASATHSWASPIIMHVPPCKRAIPERVSESGQGGCDSTSEVVQSHALGRKGWTVP